MKSLESKLELITHNYSQDISSSQLQNLLTYCNLVNEHGQNINLISRKSLDLLIENHITDAFTLLNTVKMGVSSVSNVTKNPCKLIDIGTGAGLPGLILAIMCPQLKVILLDSNLKKCNFLNLVIKKLHLQTTPEVICGRAEDYGHNSNYREQFNLATARAIGTMPIIFELSIPFLRINGLVIAQKTVSQLELECKNSQEILTTLKTKIISINDAYPDNHSKQHKIILARKEKSTPKIYPRTWTKICEL